MRKNRHSTPQYYSKRTKRKGTGNLTNAFLFVSTIYVINFVYFFIQHSTHVNNDAAYNVMLSSYLSGGSSSSSKSSTTPSFLLGLPPNPFTNFDAFREHFQTYSETNKDEKNVDDYYLEDAKEDDDWNEKDEGDDYLESGYADEDDEYLEEINTKSKESGKPPADNQTSPSPSSSSYLTMYGKHRVQPALDALPKWFRDYTQWNHQVTPEGYVQSNFDNNYNSTKYLVLTCLPQDKKCGGLTDRLRALPFFLFAAKRTSRVLCIHWAKPFPLEYFLIPPQGGIEWRCPAELGRLLDYTKRARMQPNVPIKVWHTCDPKEVKLKQCNENVFEEITNSDSKFIITAVKKNSHGRINAMNEVAQRHSYKEIMPRLHNWDCPDMIGDMFRVMFEPVQPLAVQINATMTRLGLVEKQYVTAHTRSRYPSPALGANLEDPFGFDKDGGYKWEGKLKKHIVDLVLNALHCVHLLQPDLPILFLADDENTVEFASNGFKHRKKKYNFNPIVIQREQSPKHFDTSTKNYKNLEEFYPVFEDLLIMGGSKCVSHGLGSFGSLGAGLTGNKCRALHRTPRGRRDFCPNTRYSSALIQEKIDPNEMLFGESVGGEGTIEYISHE